METKAEAYRLKPDTKARIAEMAQASHRTKTDVVRLAVDTLYAKHVEAVREGQERARATTALLAELRKRLGEGLGIVSGQSIGFSEEGPIAVTIGDITYVQADGATITAQREVGGRYEMAILAEDGTCDWIAAGPSAAQIAMN